MKIKFLGFIVLFLLFSMFDFLGKSSLKKINRINNKQEIVIAVDTFQQNYCKKNGQTTGYQSEILKAYSKTFNTSFKVLPISDKNKRLFMLYNGNADVAIFNDKHEDILQIVNDDKKVFVSIPLDDVMKSVWVTAKRNSDIIARINIFISELKSEPSYRYWHIRYFDSTYHGKKGTISQYDHWFKKYSNEIGWDWRLLAALSYQESKFDPSVESNRGAYGLMQIMPQTADYIGVDSIEHPENNIRAGVKLIRWLYKQFDKENISDEEMLNFILSAYNAGIGRIQDCRKFAHSQGKNPNIWDEVKTVIPLMIEKEHYEGEYIQQGKFKGDETLNFVDEVLNRFEYYKLTIPS